LAASDGDGKKAIALGKMLGSALKRRNAKCQTNPMGKVNNFEIIKSLTVMFC
jgi:hypothetical protein